MRKLLVSSLVLISSVAFAQVSSHQSTMPQTSPHGTMSGAGPHGSDPHMGGASTRTKFAQECGVKDASPEKAIYVSRAKNGSWSKVTAQQPGSDSDNALARVWHDKNWVLVLHESGASGDTMHTGDECFDDKGNATKLLDHYVDPKSGVVRITTTIFGGGKVQSRKQDYRDLKSGELMKNPPENANAFPPVFNFTKLEQLPFYGFIKSAK